MIANIKEFVQNVIQNHKIIFMTDSFYLVTFLSTCLSNISFRVNNNFQASDTNSKKYFQSFREYSELEKEKYTFVSIYQSYKHVRKKKGLAFVSGDFVL